MRHKSLFAVLLAITLVFFSLVLSKTMDAASPPEGPSRQGPPQNVARVDITINDAGNITIGGINLAALGVAPLDPQVAMMAKNIGNVNVQVQDQTVAVAVQDTQVARLLWSPEQREAAAALAASYGVQLQPAVQNRVEEWISTSDIDLTARYTNEAARPIVLSLSKPIQVDIMENGQLAIEGGALATGIDPMVLQQIRMGGNRAVACWNEGTLSSWVNGEQLPTLVVNPAGVDIIAQALNLPINGDGASAILNARVGVDLSLPGGTHSANADCSQ